MLVCDMYFVNTDYYSMKWHRGKGGLEAASSNLKPFLKSLSLDYIKEMKPVKHKYRYIYLVFLY